MQCIVPVAYEVVEGALHNMKVIVRHVLWFWDFGIKVNCTHTLRGSSLSTLCLTAQICNFHSIDSLSQQRTHLAVRVHMLNDASGEMKAYIN